MKASDVLSGAAAWSVEQGDAVAFLDSLPADSVDLIFFSPPYSAARLYLEDGEDKGIARGTDEWVRWMLDVFRAACRACRGLVACVCDDQTQDYRYGCGPYLLMADLHRAGFNLRRPCVYRRSGIPGSGGPDWFRCDHEPIICVTRPGKLPWSDNAACGHPPKWAPGGEMSHRLANGRRVNQRGRFGGKRSDGTDGQQPYAPPVLANPGTVVQRLYSAQEVAGLLGEPSDVVDCVVGGGQMGEGDAFSRQNEAPFPEELAERFVRSFCPPGGVCCDPFSGSGTTGAVAVRWGRRFVGSDLRESQVRLSRRRIAGETPLSLFVQEGTPDA